MKRGGPLKRYTPLRTYTGLKTYTPLKKKSTSDVALIKEDIQAYCRDIVIIRDGGCIFRNEQGHVCSGFANDGHLILQADHLVTRANSATYADTRLIVCVCKGIHGWKSVGGNMRKAQYDERVKKLISPERVELWERCEADVAAHRSHRTTVYDWKMALAVLKGELAALQLGS